ncbi:DUF305 domain-containing protein [Streptomyces cinereoruber]|uniref:DUF305 domain-containing protein n=1 Tax=Streptomyces cinereoruber TaxID=67260 RepID=UPI00363B848E
MQLMIPMNERARLLTGLAPSRTADPALVDLAARTGTRLERELADLRALLDLSGTPDTRPHEGHDMPGMVGLDTLRKAEKAKGEQFERILTEGLRAHLAQTGKLCASERTSGGSEEAKALAATIAGSAVRELDRLTTTNRP